MKTLKITLLSLLSIFVIFYLTFLFVLPYTIDLNKYSSQITQEIQDKTGFVVKIKGLKVTTAWNLSAGALIDRTDLNYPTGKKFAQINNLRIRLSLVPLIFRKIIIDKVSSDKLMMNIDVKSDGKFLLEDYIKNDPNKLKALPFSFKISENMPDIVVKTYRFSFVNGAKNYSLKGNDLKISDFIFNKKIKLKTHGGIFLNDKKQINYNIQICSKVFPKPNAKSNNIMEVFDELYKYRVFANINTNLKIKNQTATKSDDIDIDGKLNIDKISFALGNKIFPDSNLSLDFTGDKAKINSIFYDDVNSKAYISGWFRNGKNKFIDLQVASDRMNIEHMVLIAKTMSGTFGIKELKDISASGFVKANFALKSDFKTIESSGYLKVKNANITNKLYNVALSSVNADIDFSQDAVKIRQANANLNSQPITISGVIDRNANANISVLANNLQLKGVLFTLGKTKILKENDIQSGLINVNASLKGRLDKAFPKVNVTVSNIDLMNKPSKARIKASKLVLNTESDEKKQDKIKGKALITNLKVTPNFTGSIYAPNINLVFDEKTLSINKTPLYINNIKTTLDGKVSNINAEPRLSNVTISAPNQFSMPLSGYAGSNIILKGKFILSGNLYHPEMQGSFMAPSIRIPSTSTYIKNAQIQINKDITLVCPQVQVADSLMRFSAKIVNPINSINSSNGLVIKNIDSSAENIDLNTLIPVLRNISKGSSSGAGLTILSGKTSIKKFKVGSIVANNITSNMSMRNNILYFDSLRGEAYFGKIGGSASYDFKNRKTKLNLQGRGMSANPALIGLTGRNDDINGQLDFDSNVSIVGYSQDEILRSLKGSTNFIISNGKMGMLGKFEHLLYAQNIISNNVFKASLNLVAKAITVKNTGVYKYMKGKLTFTDGWANIIWVKTSGPSMSLYMTGRYNIPYNNANLVILGRISNDVVRILGPIGEFSMDKVISYVPKIGEITTFFANQITTNPNYENTSMIPYLTPKTEFSTKEFKVIIDGDVQKQSSVKSFKWLARPRVVKQNNEQNIMLEKPHQQAIPDFVKKLPDYKN